MLVHVPLDQIDDNPYQRRQDYGDVAGLAADIEARGLLQTPRGRLLFDGRPVSIEKVTETLTAVNGWPGGESFRVEIAFGHRRLRALRHLSQSNPDWWKTLPIYVEALTDDQMLDAVWSENQHRSDINAIEQAELLAEKVERARAAGGNQSTVAAEWHIDRSTVANKLRLLELPLDVQTAVRERRLSERQALALLPVVEMQTKLNGAVVEWNPADKPEYYGRPVAPDTFIRFAVANPDKATSDTIRDFARRVADYAGHEMPDYLARFEAGEGETIVQSACAGCAHRHNQHCLNQPCFDARLGRFQETIPLRAAELTGLPWSADPDCFAQNEERGLRTLQAAGVSEGLVVGWMPAGYYLERPNGSGWRSTEQVIEDWREGLILGLLPEYANSVDDQEPPRREWRDIRYRARDRMQERAQAAFVEACAPLVDRYEELRPLLALMRGQPGGIRVEGETPAEVIADIVRQHYHRLYLRDRDQTELKLAEGGLDKSVLEPTDPIERLRETAASALDKWYEWRDASTTRRAMGAKGIKAAVALFHQHDIGPDDDELGDLAVWLERAEMDAAAIMRPQQVEQPEGAG